MWLSLESSVFDSNKPTLLQRLTADTGSLKPALSPLLIVNLIIVYLFELELVLRLFLSQHLK